jgi:hypothetical protein
MSTAAAKGMKRPEWLRRFRLERAKKLDIAFGLLLVAHCNWFSKKVASVLPVATAGGHPLAPFVVGEDGDGDKEEDEDAEEKFHGEASCQWSVVSCQ